MTPLSTRLRVVIDTNLFVSGTIFKRGNRYVLLEAWRASEFFLLLFDSQFRELVSVFSRPKLVDRYALSPDELATLFNRLAAVPPVEPVVALPVAIRDAKDAHILAAALGGDADYLVTGDDDLLVLHDDPRLPRPGIVTAVEFLSILRERGQSERRDTH
jgi:hypothetical protein